MIWEAIKSDGSRLLVKCPTKVDAVAYREILKDHLFSFCQESEFLIQDNAPIHKAKTTMKLIEDSKICYMSDWPSQSPDLNIIENMWSVLKSNLWKYNTKNINELWSLYQEEWMSIDTSPLYFLRYRGV